jgi:hypothetical protein
LPKQSITIAFSMDPRMAIEMRSSLVLYSCSCGCGVGTRLACGSALPSAAPMVSPASLLLTSSAAALPVWMWPTDMTGQPAATMASAAVWISVVGTVALNVRPFAQALLPSPVRVFLLLTAPPGRNMMHHAPCLQSGHGGIRAGMGATGLVRSALTGLGAGTAAVYLAAVLLGAPLLSCARPTPTPPTPTHCTHRPCWHGSYRTFPVVAAG